MDPMKNSYLAQNTHPPKSITAQQLMSNSNHRSKPGKKNRPNVYFLVSGM